MNLTPKQWFLAAQAFVSSLITSAALLNPILGEKNALVVVAILGIFNLAMGSVSAVLSSQNNVVKEVAAMPGVERIDINAKANQTLAAIALDPNVDKVAATAQAIPTVVETAKGNGNA